MATTGTATAGERGEKVKADCFVEVRLGQGPDTGPAISTAIKLEGDVDEENARALCKPILDHYKVEAASVYVEYYGCPGWVLQARLEAALMRADPALAQMPYFNLGPPEVPPSTADRFRRSRLYMSANRPRFLMKAGRAGADGIILDLEDAVAPAQKDAARIMARYALANLDFGEAERMARINQLPLGHKDLEAIVPCKPHLILLPKCESPEQVEAVSAKIGDILKEHGMDWQVFIMPIIESAMGVERAREIASAGQSVVAVTMGLEDYTADLGVQRTPEGTESLWARGRVVNAAAAARVQAIDTVFSDFKDTEGLKRSVAEAKAMGFVGKGCIHPSQVEVVNNGFAPADAEIEKARRIVMAFEKAEREGLGAVALGSKMIDPPVVKRAQKTIELAVATGKLDADWQNQ